MLLEQLRRWSRAQPWVATALAVWVAIGVGVLSRGWLQPHRANTYPHYCDAGMHWRTGVELYQDTGETCRYSPLVHALLVPFSMLPDEVGGALWRLINVTAFLFGLFWSARTTLPSTLNDRWRGLAILSTIPMAIGSLDNAQSNPLMACGLLVSVAAVALGRWNLAALELTVACLLKIYPVALALLLILVYPRQLAGRFLAFVVAGLLLPFALQDPHYVARQYGNWFTNLLVDDRLQMPLYRAYRDLWLLIRAGNLPISPADYFVIQLAGAALAAGLVVLLRRAETPRTTLLNLTLGLAACWMTLLGPATESSTYIVLAPTMGWALAELGNARERPIARALVLTSFGLFVAARLAGLVAGGTAHFHAVGPHPAGALLLAVALTGQTLRILVNPVNLRSGNICMNGQVA